MNKILLGLAAVFFFVACKNDGKNAGKAANANVAEDTVLNKKLAKHYYQVYEEAMKMQDFSTAVYAINSLMTVETTRTNLLDTLMAIYYQARNDKAAGMVAEKILKVRPSDTTVLQIAADADQKEGRFKEAELKLKKLFEITKNLQFEYYRGSNFFSAGEMEKGEEIFEKLLAMPNANNFRIPIPNQKLGKLEYPLLPAAIFYQRGAFYYSMGYKKEAIKAFEQSEKLDVKFSAPSDALLELKFGK